MRFQIRRPVPPPRYEKLSSTIEGRRRTPLLRLIKESAPEVDPAEGEQMPRQASFCGLPVDPRNRGNRSRPSRDAGVWTIPAARMKAKRDHRVPLSGRALAILHDVQKLSDGTGLVFPNPRGKPRSDATLSQLIKELGIAAVPHGFRSSFRDWAAERTSTPREVVEAALAHTVQNPTEAAYARSDLFERRRLLMNNWAAYLNGQPKSDTVSAIQYPHESLHLP